MKGKRKGFTIVEMLVIITIMSILWVIAFISFKWYTSTARNSKRLEHVSKISTLLSTERISGKSLIGYSFPGGEIPNALIAGTWAIAGKDYVAWLYNSSALGIVKEDFSDPLTGDQYRLGITLKKGASYEAATILEQGNNTLAKVIGVYTPRTMQTIWGTGLSGTKKFVIDDVSLVGNFFVGDYVTSSGLSNPSEITFMSDDGKQLILDNTFTATSTGISLAADETLGLILWAWGGTLPVTDGSIILPYGGDGTYVCTFGASAMWNCVFGS